MISINSPTARIEYVLREDRATPPLQQTVFLMRRLTWEELQDVVASSPIPLEMQLEINALQERLLAEGTVNEKNERVPRDPTPEEQARIDELIPDQVEMLTLQTQQMRQAASLGIEKIMNLVNEYGELIIEMPVEEFLEHTTAARVMELGEAVIAYSKPQAGTVKKSRAPRERGRSARTAGSAHGASSSRASA
ncbi:MAG: hypothetical protein GC151_13935 [Betaproteobacteria bacterium]|nr:hypothetical protein [Betaproteobacteria bacterium]